MFADHGAACRRIVGNAGGDPDNTTQSRETSVNARTRTQAAVIGMPRRLPWLARVLLVVTLAVAGIGFAGSGATHPTTLTNGVAASLHSAVGVVGPSALPQVTPTLLRGHAPAHADTPVGVAASAVAVLLLALAAARRSTAKPVPVLATARRLPPRRGPPAHVFTR
jgi:hypothetical protein